MARTCTCLGLIFCVVTSSELARAQERSSWARVIAVKPGTAIVLERRGALPTNRRFIAADDSELIALNPDHPLLPRDARRTLLDAAAAHPDQVRRIDGRVQFVYGNVRLAPDGIFVGDRKIAETAEIVERIPRQDVAAILTPPWRRYSAIGAVGGAVAGGVVGFHLAQRFAYSTRRDAGVWMAMSLVGLPIGGAVLGAHARTRTTQDVIYRSAMELPDGRAGLNRRP